MVESTMSDPKKNRESNELCVVPGAGTLVRRRTALDLGRCFTDTPRWNDRDQSEKIQPLHASVIVSSPMVDAMAHNQDPEPKAMTTAAAMAPWPAGSALAAPTRPATPAIDTKIDEPANLPQVASGGGYL
jgi:hypothetical protein